MEKLVDALPVAGPCEADLRPELQALIVEMLYAVPRLGAKLAGEVRLGQATSIPILRVRRAARLETRSVAARQEPYANQRLSRTLYQSPEDVDPWAGHPIAPPDELNPLRELRLPGSERRVQCRECEGRGQNPCAVCGPTSAPSCPACAGQALVPCSRCAETGDQVEYLVLESRYGSFSGATIRPLAELARSPLVSDFEASAGTPLLRLSARGRVLERPGRLPWPEVAADLDAALSWLELPAGTGCIEDTIELDALFALKAPWQLDDRSGFVEAVRDASLRQADPGLALALEARAAKFLGSRQEWLSQPEWMASLALEALDWPEAHVVHEAALAGIHRLAQELLESGRIEAMADLRPRIVEIVRHPAAEAWREQLSSLLVTHYRRCAARFRLLLGENDPGLLAALQEALASAQGPAEIAALHQAAHERVTDLLRAGEKDAAASLAKTLSEAPWPAQQLADKLLALRPEALGQKAKTIEEALDAGVDLETAFFETMSLAATAPWLTELERLARAFSLRLRDDSDAGKALLARRLRDGFGRARPDLALLFADVAGDRRDGVAINVRAALARPNGLPVAVDILLLDGTSIADEGLGRDIVEAFDQALARKLEEVWLLEAEEAAVSPQTAHELRRALEAWRKLQGWFPSSAARAAFALPLRAFIDTLLAGASSRLGEALRELAGSLECMRAARSP